MDEERNLMQKMVEMTEAAMTRMQAEVSQMTQKAQSAASGKLSYATSDDIARLQAQLDRIEAAVNDALGRRGGTGGEDVAASPGEAAGGETVTPPASAVPNEPES